MRCNIGEAAAELVEVGCLVCKGRFIGVFIEVIVDGGLLITGLSEVVGEATCASVPSLLLHPYRQ